MRIGLKPAVDNSKQTVQTILLDYVDDLKTPTYAVSMFRVHGQAVKTSLTWMTQNLHTTSLFRHAMKHKVWLSYAAWHCVVIFFTRYKIMHTRENTFVREFRTSCCSLRSWLCFDVGWDVTSAWCTVSVAQLNLLYHWIYFFKLNHPPPHVSIYLWNNTTCFN